MPKQYLVLINESYAEPGYHSNSHVHTLFFNCEEFEISQHVKAWLSRKMEDQDSTERHYTRWTIRGAFETNKVDIIPLNLVTETLKEVELKQEIREKEEERRVEIEQIENRERRDREDYERLSAIYGRAK
jgi:hypothetical protein